MNGVHLIPFAIRDRVQILATGVVGRVVGFSFDPSGQLNLLVDHHDADYPDLVYFEEPYRPDEIGAV